MLPTKRPSAAGCPNARASTMPTAFCMTIVSAIATQSSATCTPPCLSPANFADRPRPEKNTSSSSVRIVPGQANSTPGQARATHASAANRSPPVTAGGMPEVRNEATRPLTAVPTRMATIARTNIASSDTPIVVTAIACPSLEPVGRAGRVA